MPAKTTIFDHMSGLARELGAINLGQGFPDMEHSPELLEAAREALIGKSNQYPPMRGLAELRSAIADYYAQEQQLDVTADEIVVTSGATEALAASIYAFIKPGDEAIVLQPFYDAYKPLVERAGGTVKPVNLMPPDWQIPMDQLEAAIDKRTKLIILNTPNNPTGTLIGPDVLEKLGELCAHYGIFVLCDEVWEGMILDGSRHVSPLAIASLRKRAIKVGSAGKIFSLTGWKVGWAVATPPLAAAIADQHQFLTFTTATPLQWAVTEGLSLPHAWHEKHRALYARGKDRLVSGLKSAGFHVLPASGTWFVTIDLAASGFPADDAMIAERMVREVGVASIPVSAFYADDPEKGYLRLCFAKQDATLDEAVERMTRFRQSL